MEQSSMRRNIFNWTAWKDDKITRFTKRHHSWVSTWGARKGPSAKPKAAPNPHKKEKKSRPWRKPQKVDTDLQNHSRFGLSKWGGGGKREWMLPLTFAYAAIGWGKGAYKQFNSSERGSKNPYTQPYPKPLGKRALRQAQWEKELTVKGKANWQQVHFQNRVALEVYTRVPFGVGGVRYSHWGPHGCWGPGDYFTEWSLDNLFRQHTWMALRFKLSNLLWSLAMKGMGLQITAHMNRQTVKECFGCSSSSHICGKSSKHTMNTRQNLGGLEKKKNVAKACLQIKGQGGPKGHYRGTNQVPWVTVSIDTVVVCMSWW